MVHWTKRKLYAKNQGPISGDEKVIGYFGIFRDRRTDIVTFGGEVCNQKGQIVRKNRQINQDRQEFSGRNYTSLSKSIMSNQKSLN